LLSQLAGRWASRAQAGRAHPDVGSGVPGAELIGRRANQAKGEAQGQDSWSILVHTSGG
jgi:hypothetical protein